MATNAAEVATRIRKLRLHGMDLSAAERYSKRYQHWDVEYCGWKYNMDNIQAALLIPQLAHVEERWQRREGIVRRYETAFCQCPSVGLPRVLPGSKSGRHLFTISVDSDRRDAVVWTLQDRGIGVGVNYRAIHLLRYYRETSGFREGTFPVAEAIGHRTISLPLYPRLIEEDVDTVMGAVTALVS